MSRLGGAGIDASDFGRLTENHIYHLTLEEAVKKQAERLKLHTIKHVPPYFTDGSIEREMMEGTAELAKIMIRADELIEEAIRIDPRLAKKSSWVRSEEGIEADAGLVASGDDRPYYDRRRTAVSGAGSGEPCRVVISTDGKKVDPDNAAAFIAAAKLSQQFRPLEIWWQGAWLLENNDLGTKGLGHIFHVPLVSGDLDFRRLQFVLSNQHRDSASYNIMFCHAYPAKLGWGGGAAEYSYLPGGDSEFVKESGIHPSGETVAVYAARWAGMEAAWKEEVTGSEALQYWFAPEEGGTGGTKEETEKEKAKRAKEQAKWEKLWEQSQKERAKAEEKAAKNRLREIG